MGPPWKVLCLFSLFHLWFQFHLISLVAMYFCLSPLMSGCPPVFTYITYLQAASMSPKQGTCVSPALHRSGLTASLQSFSHLSLLDALQFLVALLRVLAHPVQVILCLQKLDQIILEVASNLGFYESRLPIMKSWIVLKPSCLCRFPSIFHFFFLSFLLLYYLSPGLSSHFSTSRDGLKLHRSPLTS